MVQATTMSFYLIYSYSNYMLTQVDWRIFNSLEDASDFINKGVWKRSLEPRPSWELDWWTIIEGNIVKQNGI